MTNDCEYGILDKVSAVRKIKMDIWWLCVSIAVGKLVVYCENANTVHHKI